MVTLYTKSSAVEANLREDAIAVIVEGAFLQQKDLRTDSVGETACTRGSAWSQHDHEQAQCYMFQYVLNETLQAMLHISVWYVPL